MMNKESKEYKDIHSELIKKCKKGDREAQFRIYKLYYTAMYNTSFRIVNDSMEAEDIMQESFLKAFNSLSQYKGEVSFGAWLKKIVINRSLDFLRKNAPLFESLDNIEYEDLQQSEDLENIETKGLIEKIKEEIYQLPDGYRIILNLYLFEGYDHDEISQILNISASTSRSQYARAKKKLLENLKNKY